jgi:hypothetical protein
MLSRRELETFTKRYARAESNALLWAGLHEACYFYAIPNRNKFWRTKGDQGEQKGQRVYDTTAIEATKTFVSKLHTAMTPPQTQWGYMTVDQRWAKNNPEQVNEARILLDDYMRELFSYIHESNFDVVINECYFDSAVGTACLVVNAYTDVQPLLFTSIPMDRLAVEEAMTGRLESWYRSWEDIKINEILVRWPKAVIPESFLEKAAADSMASIQKINEGVMYTPTNGKKPYIYVVAANDELLYSEAFETNPGIVWRFQKTNSDVFGRGPIMDALPSIISLNELARIELASANLNTFKPYMAFSDAVFNPHTFVMQPMSIIPIAPISGNGQPPLIPLPDSSSPQFAQLTMSDLRMQIKDLLFASSPIPDNSKQPASATELMINQQMLAERIGPLFSRLQQEFLFPLLERCAYILDSRGILPKPKIKGAKVSFQYKSPLALAKNQEQIGRVTQFVQLLQGTLGPEAAKLYINASKYPWMLANLMQLDPDFLNSPEGVAQAAQSMQDQMEAQGGQEVG